MQRKTAIVTGAARRIGRAVALRLVREDYRVVIHYGASREAAKIFQDAGLVRPRRISDRVGRPGSAQGTASCAVGLKPPRSVRPAGSARRARSRKSITPVV